MSKVAIEGNVSGTGTLTIAAPNTNSNFTLTIPDATGTIDRLNRAGNVLQVVAGTLGTATATTSTSFVDVGLSASITPSSASNKVLVLVYPATAFVSDVSNEAITFQVLRGVTKITSATNHLLFSTAILRRAALMLSVLDSPNTTSATTYKLQFLSRFGNDVEANVNSDTATITLMEIAG